MKFTGKFLVAAATASILAFAPATEASFEQDEAASVTTGINHIGFAVSNLDASARFFVETLDWKKAGGDPDYPAIFVTDGEAFVTLWQTNSDTAAIPFNRKTNVGLHHFAMTVRYIEDLHALHEKLAGTEGVTIEFAPEPLAGSTTIHMMIREPSGLRLEFITPRGRSKTDEPTS